MIDIKMTTAVHEERDTIGGVEDSEPIITHEEDSAKHSSFV